VYDGFDITIEAELRDLMEDRFQAQLISTNEVLVQIPAYSYTWLYDTKEYQKDQKCEVVKQAHVVNCNAVKRDTTRRNLLLLYTFKDIELMDPFSKTSRNDGLIEGKIHFWPVTFKIGGVQFTSQMARMSWLVGVKEDDPREAEELHEKTAGMTQLENLIAGMKMPNNGF
jgi:hypothetical protein